MLNVLQRFEDTRDETDTGLALQMHVGEDTYETGSVGGKPAAPPTNPLKIADFLFVVLPENLKRGPDLITVDNSTSISAWVDMKTGWHELAPPKKFVMGSFDIRALTFPKLHGTTDCDWHAYDMLPTTYWLGEADQLEGYEAYAVEDWDGYNALPITTETLRAARSVLTLLPKSFGDPVCSPGADGSIVFEWLMDDGPLRKLFIDIGPGRTWQAYWRLASGTTGTISRKRVTISTISELHELFETLRG